MSMSNSTLYNFYALTLTAPPVIVAIVLMFLFMVTSAIISLVIFFATLVTGGVVQAKGYLNDLNDFAKAIGNFVAAATGSCANFMAAATGSCANFILNFVAAATGSCANFILNFVAAATGSCANFILKVGGGIERYTGGNLPNFISGLIEPVAHAFLPYFERMTITGSILFSVFIVAVPIILVGSYTDLNRTLDVLEKIATPAVKATIAAWTTFSNPENLLSYAFFYVMVTVFPAIPDAIKAVALKAQKLGPTAP
jgi:hypothetical protein